MDEELKSFHSCLNEGWKVYKDFYQRIPLTDADWAELVTKVDEMVEMLNPIGQAKDVLMFYIDSLERKDKEVRKR